MQPIYFHFFKKKPIYFQELYYKVTIQKQLLAKSLPDMKIPTSYRCTSSPAPTCDALPVGMARIGRILICEAVGDCVSIVANRPHGVLDMLGTAIMSVVS